MTDYMTPIMRQPQLQIPSGTCLFGACVIAPRVPTHAHDDDSGNRYRFSENPEVAVGQLLGNTHVMSVYITTFIKNVHETRYAARRH